MLRMFWGLLFVAADVAGFSISSETASIIRCRTHITQLRVAEVSEPIDRDAIFGEIGIAEEKLALGVRPHEVLKYIGR